MICARKLCVSDTQSRRYTFRGEHRRLLQHRLRCFLFLVRMGTVLTHNLLQQEAQTWVLFLAYGLVDDDALRSSASLYLYGSKETSEGFFLPSQK